jgi:hypothetical protein
MGLKAAPWLVGRVRAPKERRTGRSILLNVILRPKMGQINGCWRNWRSEDIHNLCLSSNNTGMDKSRKTKTRYEMHRKNWLENLKRK